ncbi:MFS transporter [Pseudonocardia sp. NPDC046786]|uniref:MFS transporter n=1 Tax=Pseudonocardia sp. NPDC046786 TaxID=3155471 RepID=UPI0033EAE72C
MVSGLGVSELVSWGVLIYTFSVLVGPMNAELGWSVAQLNTAYATGLLVSALVAVPIGRWIDVRGARIVMTTGSLLSIGMLIGWSFVETLWAFFVLSVVAGVAMAMTLYEPAFAVTTSWFRVHRARAVMIITVVGGLASTVFIPLTAVLVDSVGWRNALLVLACAVALIGLPIHALLLRRWPSDLGLGPDGCVEAEPVRAGHDAAVPEISLRAVVLHTRSFRWIATSLFLVNAAKFGVIISLVAYLQDRGYSLTMATLTSGAVGLLQVVGRLAMTAVAARLPVDRATCLVFAGQGVALFFPLATTGSGPWSTVSITLFVVLFGIGFGLSELLRGTVVADYYGAGNYGRVNGLLSVFVVVARAAGPFAAGLVVTLLGSYDLVLAGAAVATLGGAGALYLVGRARPTHVPNAES